MKANLVELTKELPDANDLFELADKIRELSLKKLLLERQIKSGESDAVKRAMNDRALWQNGKPPAMSYVDCTYRFTGVDGELVPLRDEYSTATVELDRLKTRLSIYNSYLDVWRTLSATERHTSY